MSLKISVAGLVTSI